MTVYIKPKGAIQFFLGTVQWVWRTQTELIELYPSLQLHVYELTKHLLRFMSSKIGMLSNRAQIYFNADIMACTRDGS